jgi:hypothetical protein
MTLVDGSVLLTNTPPLDFSNNFATNWILAPTQPVTQNWSDIAMNASGQYQSAVVFSTVVDGGSIYISTNYGVSWTKAPSQPTGQVQTWCSITISASGQYQTALMRPITGSPVGFIYISTNYGVSWTKAPSQPVSTNWNIVTMSASGQYQVATTKISFTNVNNEYYFSTNYGNTWTSSFFTSETGYVANIEISASGQYQTGTHSSGKIYYSINYGQSWTAATGAGLTSSGFTTDSYIAISASGQYQSIVYFQNSSTINGSIFISTNYGVSWSKAPSQPSEKKWRGIKMSASGQYQIAGNDSNETYYSTNYGQNWSSTTSVGCTFAISANGHYISAVKLFSTGETPPLSSINISVTPYSILSSNRLTITNTTNTINTTTLGESSGAFQCLGGGYFKGRVTIYEESGSNVNPLYSGSNINGTLTLSHGDFGGQSSILFTSKNNIGSDYAFISYQSSKTLASTSNEQSMLTIGVQNDNGSEIIDSINIQTGASSYTTFTSTDYNQNTLTGTSSTKVGINKVPIATLDVLGTITSSGLITANGGLTVPSIQSFTINSVSSTGGITGGQMADRTITGTKLVNNIAIDTSGTIKTTNTDPGTSTTTSGAINCSGGAYFGQNVYMGSSSFSGSATTGALTVVGGVGIGGNTHITGNTFIGGNLYTTGNTTLLGNVTILNNVTGTSTSAALQVVGGAYFGKSIYMGGTGTDGILTILNATASSSSSTGALRVTGGAYFGQSIYMGGTGTGIGTLTIKNTDAGSTTNTSGAIRCDGGAYFGKSVYFAEGFTVASGQSTTGITTTIAEGAVSTTKINNGAVTGEKLNGGINISTSGTITISNQTNTINTTTLGAASGAFQCSGGGYFKGRVTIYEELSNTSIVNPLYSASTGYNTGVNGTLTLSHGDDGGQSSILFTSKNNIGSDYAFISYQSASTIGGSGEKSMLTIGVQNDRNPDTVDTINIQTSSGSYSSYTTFTSSDYNQNTSTGTSNTRVGINKVPIATLDVLGTITASGLITASNGLTVPTGQIVTISSSEASTGSTSGAIRCTGGAYFGGATYCASTITATSFTTTSDYRIKDNIENLDDKFTIDNLRPITYLNNITKKQDIGIIAHELQEIYPFLVEGKKDDNKYQSVNYTGLIGILIKEIQDLKKDVQELKKEIQELKNP